MLRKMFITYSFPEREWGEFKASLLVGERFGERFSRSREKSEP
jgi:hypothetical protein